MPQEMPTCRYFRKHRIEFTALRPSHIRQFVERWIDRPAELTELRQRMQTVRCMTTPESALEKLLGR